MVFGRKKEEPSAQSVVDQAHAASTEPVVGKGAPTPKRKVQEAARKRPLVPTDRKASKEAERVAIQDQRQKMRQALDTGDEKYLPLRDKGPQKRFVRDYVDARFSVGEFLIPVMLIVIVLTFLPSQALQFYGLLALWGFFAIAVIDCVVLGFLIQRRVGDKFGKTKVERGLRWYGAMRALQLRIMRLPKPQVKRGQYPS